MIHAIDDPLEKSNICQTILRALPEWFGNLAAIEEYAVKVKALPLWAASESGTPIGFLALKPHTAYAAEICVMGVAPGHHRQGIGRALMENAVDRAIRDGFAYLTVKTLADTDPYEPYARTRGFYLAQGFVPLEVLPDYWDKDNPCLILIKPLPKYV